MISREKLLAVVVSALARALLTTVRLRLEDRAGFTTNPPDFPTIITFWHNRICAITLTFLRKYHPSRRGVVVLTSPSRDGEILAGVMAAFHMSSVRGSSSRRGSQALLELTEKIRQGFDIAVTPDGPRGPQYYLHPGLLFLARATEARILPVHAHFSHAITLKSWDGFRIPLPFSRVDVIIAPYETVSKSDGEESFEAERTRIETILKNEAD